MHIILKQLFLKLSVLIVVYFLKIYLIPSNNRFIFRHKNEYLQNTCMKAFKDINCLFIWSNSNFLALILPVFLHNHNNVHIISIYRQMSFLFCWQFCVVIIFDVARCDRTISSFCIYINTIPYIQVLLLRIYTIQHYVYKLFHTGCLI